MTATTSISTKFTSPAARAVSDLMGAGYTTAHAEYELIFNVDDGPHSVWKEEIARADEIDPADVHGVFGLIVEENDDYYVEPVSESTLIQVYDRIVAGAADITPDSAFDVYQAKAMLVERLGDTIADDPDFTSQSAFSTVKDDVTVHTCICGTVPLLDIYHEDGIGVTCPHCGISVGGLPSVEEAADAWNHALDVHWKLFPTDVNGNAIHVGDYVHINGCLESDRVHAVGPNLVVIWANGDYLTFNPNYDDIEVA